jgi:hypothetical protein
LPFLVNFGLISMRDFLQSIGRTLPEVKRAQDFNTPIQAYVRAAGNRFLELMIQRVDEENANATFKLRQGLGFEDTRDNEGTTLQFTSEEDYALTRDQGISGTENKRDTPYSFTSNNVSSSMVDSVAEWIRAKGFIAPEWAVAVNITKFGYDGIHFIDAAFNDSNLDAMNSQLAQIMENSAIGIIQTIIPQFK